MRGLASTAIPSDSSPSPGPGRRKKPLACWMYRRAPQAIAARWRLPPPSSLNFRSPGAASDIRDGSAGSAVSSSMTTSARASFNARPTAAASRALTRATVAPRSARTLAPASDRVMPVTLCPRRTSSATSGRPMAPLAPATKTFMAVTPWSVLLGHGDVLDALRVDDPRQQPGLHLAGVRRHPVQAPGRFVEGLARLQDLRGLVVDRPLVLTLEDVAE